MTIMAYHYAYKIIALLFLVSTVHLASAQDKKPAKPTDPVDARESVKSKEPTKHTKSAQTAKGAKPAKTAEPATPAKSREVTAEFPCDAEAVVFLENMLYGIHIIATSDNKVRAVTTVQYHGPDISNDQWLKILGLQLSGTTKNIVVRTGGSRAENQASRVIVNRVYKKGTTDVYTKTLLPNGIAILDSGGNWVNKKSNIRRTIVLYIPARAKTDIESRYGDITLESNMGETKIRINNANLVMKNADVCTITSDYARIYTDQVNNMKAEIKNGSFSAKNIGHLEINSANSTIEITSIQKLDMLSELDQYDIEEAGVISGEKKYGDLRVTSLKTSFDITGNNADIKIRIIEPAVGLVKIDNKYANLRLPVSNLKNYTLSLEGGSTNTYAPFIKKDETGSSAPENKDQGSSFKATAGTGKPTTFNLKCNNCMVDLN
jgi:hypothetical protein